jgi:hypothetical protein
MTQTPHPFAHSEDLAARAADAMAEASIAAQERSYAQTAGQ